MRSALVSLLLCCWACSAFAQSERLQLLEPDIDQPISDSARISLMVDMAAKMEGTGSTREAAALFREAYLMADSLGNVDLMQKASVAYAVNLLDRDNPDSAIAVLEQPLKLVTGEDQPYRLLDLLGTAYRFKSDLRRSLESYQKALSLVDSVENPRKYAAISQNMAVVLENMGNKAQALNHYLKGVEYAEAANDSLFLATVLNNLGELYNQFEEPDKAEYYLERSKDISEKINNRMGLLRSVSNLANTKKTLLEFDEALSLYNQALELHKEIRFNTPPFRIIHNLGTLHLSLGNFDQAEKNFLESLEYSKEQNIPQGLFYNYNGLGNVAEEKGEIEGAIEYHRQALQIAGELGMATQQQVSAEKLYSLSKQSQDFQQALAYYEQFEAIADSLQQLETDQKLSETEAILELRQQEEINALLQEKHQAQEARIATQNWLILASLIIIVLILVSVVLLYRSKEENQRMNEELELQRNQLQQMNKVKDKILAIIAHDLRSPLSSMQGMLYLLREDELSQEEIQSMAGQMELSLSQNIGMMDNLLIWAREQMTGLAVNIQEVDAHAIVEEIFTNYEFKADQKGVAIINKVSTILKVQADRNLLKLILRNLVANSLKYTKEGDAITISTREQEGKIAFEVNDTGIGIPEEDQRDLFTLYGRSRYGTHNEKGSGLGLSLCKEFVEKQDGEIAVQSIVGEGTTFSFTLPRAS